MDSLATANDRVFTTAWFSKAAKKSHIHDDELCAAIAQVMLGQADDLGGGVYKKRLGRNLYRSIILARSGRHWVYEHLFAKQDQANISDRELSDLRILATSYGLLTAQQMNELLHKGLWMEICNGNETEV
jgi:hypothetical protein